MAEIATIHQINKGTQPPSTSTNNQGDKPAPKTKLTKVLPTNRIGLDKQLLLLRAYAAAYISFNEPVSIRQVAGVAKMDRTGISLANGFLLDVGLLTRSGNGFIPTEPTVAFNHAYEWNAETAPQKLAGALQRAWFAQKLTPLIMMGAISENDAIRELAAESSAGPEHKGQLKILLEILEKSGVIKRENDSYVRGTSFRRTDAPDVIESDDSNTPVSAPEHREKEPMRDTPIRSATTTTFNQMTAGAVQFSINVKVDVTELAGWEADRIKALFAGIAQVLAAKADVEQDIDV